MKIATVIHTARGAAFVGAAVALTIGLFSPFATAADPQVQTRQVTVRFAELDLQKPAGISELYRRIKAAASQACYGAGSSFGRVDYAEFQRCREAAVANAIRDLDNGPLADLHARAARSVGRPD